MQVKNTGRSDFFFFLTSSKEKMDDVSEPTDATNEWMKLRPDQQLNFFLIISFLFSI